MERIKEGLKDECKKKTYVDDDKVSEEKIVEFLKKVYFMKTGRISCMDCGSTHIAYESADSEFSFDISTTKMRKQILDAVQEKVDIYNEEIVRLTNEITVSSAVCRMGRGNKQFLTENPDLQNNFAVNITLFGVYRYHDSGKRGLCSRVWRQGSDAWHEYVVLLDGGWLADTSADFRFGDKK